MAQLIRCPHCNKFIDKDSNICPKCSQPLTDKKPVAEKEAPMQEKPRGQKPAPKPEPVQEITEPEVTYNEADNEAPVYKPYNADPEPEVEQPDKPVIDEPDESVYTEPESSHIPEPEAKRPVRKTSEPETELKENEEEQISTDKEMEAFYASMQQKEPDNEKEEKKSDDAPRGKKIADLAGNFASNIVNNSKAIIGKGKAENAEEADETDEAEEIANNEVPKENTPKATYRKERVKPDIAEAKKPTYNANADGYYDYVTAEIDARTEHVTTEMVIKTISFIAIVIVVVVGMINFI
jgi:phage FluMu protein Com